MLVGVALQAACCAVILKLSVARVMSPSVFSEMEI